MARHEWGPLEKPVEHNVKPIAADGAEGEPTEFHSNGKNANPRPHENYNATDGRHNKADHQGWASVDPRSGTSSEANSDTWEADARFPDGPGPWRQT